MPSALRTFLDRAERDLRAAAHRRRLEPIVDPHVARQSRGEKHPVYDFLFEYYSFRPSWLLRWGPGFGAQAEGSDDPGPFQVHRLDAARYLLKLLETTAERPARFGCFGLHEWAMVYRAPEVRHAQLPLRLSRDRIDEVVREHGVVCSHYDAFRFFTPDAVPLNRLQPAKSAKLEFEQCGCLHVNMDLYKWAYKFWPWIPSDLIADAFLLAARIREVDMRASPYDVTSLGFDPICIETPDGREEYRRLQEQFSAESQPLRAQLIDVYRNMIAWAVQET